MCLFIYTLPQQCGHTYFQNVSECPIARGIEPTTENRLDSTLLKPKFLFDTSRSQTYTPQFYSRIFTCTKRKAIRPVPALCDRCAREKEREAVKERQLRVETCLMAPSWGAVEGSESSGSLVALVGAGPTASSTSSSLHDTSGTSTPRSVEKMWRPSEMV